MQMLPAPRSARRQSRTGAVLLAMGMIATVLFISTPPVLAVSGVANTYQVASVAGGVPDSSALNPGDCALVIQMTGTIASGLGTYEILDPANSTPTRVYSDTDAVQFVILPGGCASAQTIDAGGVQAQPWNGATGGVVFLGGTTLTMSDSIDVTGAGYTSTNGPNAGSDGCALPNTTNNFANFTSGSSGGGGVFGGGAGGAGPSAGNYRPTAPASQLGEAGTGGTTTTAGIGGIGGVALGRVGNDGCDGGAPGAPGNGGSVAGVNNNANKWGTSGGGGSYGGGGSACGAWASSAYSAGGSGGGSYTGGGSPGVGGIHAFGAEPGDGNPGNPPEAAEITDASHYLNEADPRLMMGGAGGDADNVGGGGAGGGIVLLNFASVSGGAVLANGGEGTAGVAQRSGSSGGAGGQIKITGLMSALDVQANGGDGGNGFPSSRHIGVDGSGGGAGGIWLDGAISTVPTNTGPNASDDFTEPDAPVVDGVTWSVEGGYGPNGQIPVAWDPGFGGETVPADNPKGGRACASGGGGDGLLVVNELPPPVLSLEKSTNGLDSDVAPGQTLVVGQEVTWTYTVGLEGIGTAQNVVVTDDQVGAGDIACDIDGDGTFESGNVVGAIASPASFVCQATSIVEDGPYVNNGSVTGDELIPREDPSNYVGVQPAITLEKQTNGVEADTDLLNDGTETNASISDGSSNPQPIGDPVTWTFQITNNGSMPLANVQISDITTTANDQNHAIIITCDWASSSDPATATDFLQVGETVPCSATGIAGTGLHENTATVTGDAAGTQDLDGNGEPVYDGSGNPVFTPNLDGTFDQVIGADGNPIEVTDADASGYDGRPPSVDIVKTVTGTPDGEVAAVVEGQAVEWTFNITNDGTGTLTAVTVGDPTLDAMGVVITCDWANSSDPTTDPNVLSQGETVICTAVSAAGAADLTNNAEVVGVPFGGTPVSDEDPASYTVGEPEVDIVKTTCTDTADVPGSCSDGPTIPTGDPLAWYYVITNTGEVALVNVTLADDIEAGVDTSDCDWANSSDPATAANILSVGETVSCTQTATAGIGDYDNVGETEGTPGTPEGLEYETPDGDPLPPVTADDPSSYVGLPLPAIDIEKDTNGFDADTGTGPLIFQGDDVTWTFRITNTGNVDLGSIFVTDTVTLGNGTVADPLGVVCDWDGSTDPATPADTLSVDEVVTCTAESTAELNQYRNNSQVIGVGLDEDGNELLDDNGLQLVVNDEDPSAYFGPNASIDIEKDTNGNQADIVDDQDVLSLNDPILWTFDVVNNGNLDLAGVVVTDAVAIDNGTVVDAPGVVCDWGASSDPATPAGNLSIDETVTCTASSMAAAGQYGNNATVVGTPVDDAETADPNDPDPLQDENGTPLPPATDEDPSHYYGTPNPSIDIEKDTNGNQADIRADQSFIPIGDEVIWTFVVTNDGDVDLAGVVVTDSLITDNGTVVVAPGVVCNWGASSDVNTPARNLSVGETVTCTASSTAAAPGQYANNSDVVGTPVLDAETADPDNPGVVLDENGIPLPNPTDEDPSHYYGIVMPEIMIEKDTNGFDADSGTGPLIVVGDDVVWTFEVVNTGNVALGNVVVTDTVTTSNGTAVDPDGVVCDWGGSSDPGTVAGVLSVDETVSCTASSTAELGQYQNNSSVIGVPLGSNGTPLLDEDDMPLPPVTDEDPSAYFGPNASIDIEKDTNGNQADLLDDQDIIAIGNPVVWTFDVVNDGNVDLAGVVVTDTVVTDNGTVPDAGGVVCDWAGSSDPDTPAGNLSVDETVTCTASSSAALGQYANNSDVVGTPVADAETADPINPVPLEDENGTPLANVTDEDPSHYFGTSNPSIDIEKDTNGNQADVIADQNSIAIGDPVVWTFVVVNDGNTDLAAVAVTDTVDTDNGTEPDPGGVVCDWAGSSDPDTPAGNLSVDEMVTCTSSSSAAPGQYGNNSGVVGTPVLDAETADPTNPVPLEDENGAPLANVTDEDPSHYYGMATPVVDIEKATNGFDADTLGFQPNIAVGDPVTWTFLVGNAGDVDLGNVVVTDTITLDNGTAAPVVVCDWDGSSDPNTIEGILSVGETLTCTASATAQVGQYTNNSVVTGIALTSSGDPLPGEDGEPLPPVTDEDPSGYLGLDPSIDIEKDTNDNQADVIDDQDSYNVGDAILWTFVVVNDGNVDLAAVVVTDTVVTDNGTVPDAGGVVCDWVGSSDPDTPAGNLSVDETVTCTSSSTAEAGQYANNSDVVGTPVFDAEVADPVSPTPLLDDSGTPLANVTDEDPSHYFGTALPSVDIEKDTNGVDADLRADQPFVPIGDAVTWMFEIVNDGDVDLGDVVVTDTVTTDNGTPSADVVCDWSGSSDPDTAADTLSAGETVTCTASSIAAAGQYANNAQIVGIPVGFDGTPLTTEDGDPLPPETDEDPSHYYGIVMPEISIEKDTNGFDADSGTGPLVFEGDGVVWTFEVVNTGNVALGNVVVTDTVVTSNGTAVDPDGVVCDWDGSSDPGTVAGVLSVDETVTCTADSSAELGQYQNNSSVIGVPLGSNGTPLLDEDDMPLPPVTDEDPSAYFGPNASIDIEKDTNGNQADLLGDQDSYNIGEAILWTFVVVNDGNVDLAAVVVTDTVVTDNGTEPDAGGVLCDWAGSSDPDTPAGNLSVDETVTCTSSSTAEAGQYANNSDVVGTPVADAETADPINPVPLEDESGTPLANVTDEDPSHYFGIAMPSVDIEKDTNGVDADTGTGPLLLVGDVVTWTFEIANDGDVDLGDVVVTDTVTTDNGTPTADVVCDWSGSSDPDTPADTLSAGETVTCTASSTAANGQHINNAVVTGVALSSNGTPLRGEDGEPLPPVSDEDPSGYLGTPVPVASIAIEKDTNGVDADTAADQPSVAAGSAVLWTFVVTNDGNVDLAGVVVTDAVVIDNGTEPDPDGVVCDWAGSSDSATPAGNLSASETVTCTSSSIAAAGEYANLADVVGTPVDDAETADPANPTPREDENGVPFDSVTAEDPSHYFGAVFDLALRKQLDDGTNDAVVAIGSTVTFTIAIINQGNVAASQIEIVDYLPADLALTDSAWVEDGGTAIYDLGDLVLQPGQETTVDITTRVTGSADLENTAEIKDATGVDSAGVEVRVVNSANVFGKLVDIDSVPDASNTEDPVDDEVDGLSSDEDDHDRAGLTVASAPAAPQPVITQAAPSSAAVFQPPAPVQPVAEPAPSVLALTGAQTRELVTSASLVILGGWFLVLGERRRTGTGRGRRGFRASD